jgi:hypothetical protein
MERSPLVYFAFTRPQKPEGAAHASPDLTNATQQQEIITRLANRGVNVTEPRADLQNGDTTAVKAWLENYLHAMRGRCLSVTTPEDPSHWPIRIPASRQTDQTQHLFSSAPKDTLRPDTAR